jgi:hypothetical protein
MVKGIETPNSAATAGRGIELEKNGDRIWNRRNEAIRIIIFVKKSKKF